MKRTLSIPDIVFGKPASVQVLFSGGLDSSILAAILAINLDPSICIDLVNISFDAATSADRISSLFAYYEIRNLAPKRQMRLLCADYEIKEVMDQYE